MRYQWHRTWTLRDLAVALAAGGLLGMFWSAVMLSIMIVAVNPWEQLPFAQLAGLGVAGTGGLVGLGLVGAYVYVPVFAWRRRRAQTPPHRAENRMVCLNGTGARVMETSKGTILFMMIGHDPYLVSYHGRLPQSLNGRRLAVYGRPAGVLIAADRIEAAD